MNHEYLLRNATSSLAVVIDDYWIKVINLREGCVKQSFQNNSFECLEITNMLMSDNGFYAFILDKDGYIWKLNLQLNSNNFEDFYLLSPTMKHVDMSITPNSKYLVVATCETTSKKCYVSF
jgi:hypothetical protein